MGYRCGELTVDTILLRHRVDVLVGYPVYCSVGAAWTAFTSGLLKAPSVIKMRQQKKAWHAGQRCRP